MCGCLWGKWPAMLKAWAVCAWSNPKLAYQRSLTSRQRAVSFHFHSWNWFHVTPLSISMHYRETENAPQIGCLIIQRDRSQLGVATHFSCGCPYAPHMPVIWLPKGYVVICSRVPIHISKRFHKGNPFVLVIWLSNKTWLWSWTWH